MSSDFQERAVIALGSNEGQSERIIRETFHRLESRSRGPLSKSSLWKTEPVDCPPGTGPFINAVAALLPVKDETPETLLGTLLGLESEAGRRRTGIRNAPRPLDLDLIFFAQERRSGLELTLPHPRWFCRRFVLEPLAELAPDYVAPGQEKTVRELLNRLEDSFVVRRVIED